VHEPGDVLEADVAGEKLFVIEDADAAVARYLVAFEREVDFLDPVALRARAKSGFRPGGSTAEQNAVGWLHRVGS
jgi:hypothetical protein